jgi:hypothetical protein
MSGYSDDLIAHQGVLEPPFAFLNKPISISVLTAKIREMLDS